jgi:hypothetical protein
VSAFIGEMVWLAMLPDIGPMPGIVTATQGDTVDVLLMHPDLGAQPLKSVTPWLVEDGTDWGWCDIPAGGAVPPDFFDPVIP